MVANGQLDPSSHRRGKGRMPGVWRAMLDRASSNAWERPQRAIFSGGWSARCSKDEHRYYGDAFGDLLAEVANRCVEA